MIFCLLRSFSQSSVEVYKIYDLRTFLPGATPIVDSVTDWRAAFQACINQITITKPRGAIIMVPGQHVFVSGTVYDTAKSTSTNTAIIVRGMGGNGAAYITGSHSSVGWFGPTMIFTNSITDTVFNVDGSSSMSFENVGIVNTNASNSPTAQSIGIYYGNASFMHMRDSWVAGFGMGIDIKNGYQWQMDNVSVTDAHIIGMRVQDSLFNDAGDSRIHNCSFAQSTVRGAGSTLFQYISGGGLIMANCKFNGGGAGSYPAICIDAPLLGTVDFNVHDCSFENFTQSAFNVHTVTGAGFSSINFHDNQIDRYGAGGYAGPIVIMDGTASALNLFTIHDNQIIGSGGKDTAIYLKNLAQGSISHNYINGFSKYGTNIVLGTGVNANVIIVPPQNGQVLTESGGVVLYDPNYGWQAGVTLTGNDTLKCLNCNSGQEYLIQATQNATGNFHFITSFGNITQGSTTVTLNNAANSTTTLHGYTAVTFLNINDINRSYLNGQIPVFQNGLIGDQNIVWNASGNAGRLFLTTGANSSGGLWINGTSTPCVELQNNGTEQGLMGIVTTSGNFVTGSITNDNLIRGDTRLVLAGGSVIKAAFTGTATNFYALPTSVGTPNIMVHSTTDSSMMQITPAALATLLGVGSTPTLQQVLTAGNTAATTNMTVQDITNRHNIGNGTAPTTNNLGTNVSSATLTGTDDNFQVVVVTSGVVSGTIFKVTFNTTWGSTPHTVFSPQDAVTGTAATGLWGGSTNASTVTFGGTITGAGTYTFNFITRQ